MVSWKTLTKGWTLSIWIILILAPGTTPDPIDSRCTLPQIQSPWSNLRVYIRGKAQIDVIVYSCQYTVNEFCYDPPCRNCTRGGQLLDNRAQNHYSDVGTSCLNALETNKFRDRFGNLHDLSGSKGRFSEKCENNTLFRTITLDVTKYETQADVSNDVIVLRTGSECKYSSGFCHDTGIDGDVMWRAKNQTNSSCKNLTEVYIYEAYYFILNQKTYAVIEIDIGYFPLELKDTKSDCGFITWGSNNTDLFVSEGPIESQGSIDPKRFKLDAKYFNSSGLNVFSEKQDLYDFLVKDCRRKLGNTKVLRGKVEDIKSVMSVKNSPKDTDVDFYVLVSYYLSIVNTSCFVSILLYSIYGMYKKVYCSVNCTVSNPSSASSVAYGSNLYDTVLS